MIWFTIIFALFLFTCILLADMGKLEFLMRLIHSFPFGDKIIHFFAIGLLSFLVNRTALLLFPRKNPRLVLAVTTLFLLVLFTLEELSQFPIPGRDASLFDLAANNAGTLTFAWLAWQTGKKAEGKPIR